MLDEDSPVDFAGFGLSDFVLNRLSLFGRHVRVQTVPQALLTVAARMNHLPRDRIGIRTGTVDSRVTQSFEKQKAPSPAVELAFG